VVKKFLCSIILIACLIAGTSYTQTVRISWEGNDLDSLRIFRTVDGTLYGDTAAYVTVTASWDSLIDISGETGYNQIFYRIQYPGDVWKEFEYLAWNVGAYPTAADVYTYFTDIDREDVFKADISGLATIQSKVDSLSNQADSLSNQLDSAKDSIGAVPVKAYAEFTDGTNEDAFKADLTGTNAKIDSLSNQADSLSNQMDSLSNQADSLSNQSDTILDTAQSIPTKTYAEFIDGSNEDAFKADVTDLDSLKHKVDSLSTQLDSVRDTLVDLPVKTYAEFISGSNEDAFKADVTDLDSLKHKVDSVSTQLDSIRDSLLDVPEKAYAKFTDGTNENAFKADVSAVEASVDSLSNQADTILADLDTLRAKTDSLSNQADTILDTAKGVPAKAYAYFISGSNEDVFKDGWTPEWIDSILSAVENNALSLKVWNIAFSTGFTAGSMGDSLQTASYVQGASGAQTWGEDEKDSVLHSIENGILPLKVLNVAFSAGFTAGSLGDSLTNDSYVQGSCAQEWSSVRIDSVMAVIAAGGRLSIIQDSLNAFHDWMATAASILALNNISAADVYAYFVLGSNEDAFKANVSGLSTLNKAEVADTVFKHFTEGTNPDLFKADVAGLSTLTAEQAAEAAYTKFTEGSNEDAFKASTAAVEASVDSLSNQADPLSNQLDSLTQKVDSLSNQADTLMDSIKAVPTVAEIYAHFILGSNEDAFKADLTTLTAKIDTTCYLMGYAYGSGSHTVYNNDVDTVFVYVPGTTSVLAKVNFYHLAGTPGKVPDSVRVIR
jgi:prefoldin subunit 5